MNSSRDALLIGNPQQHRGQHVAFLLVECGEQSLLVFARNLPNPPQRLFTSLGQVKGIQPPVVRIRFSFHKASLFKIVQNRNQPAGMNAKPPGKFLLAQSGGGAQQPQNARIRRGKVDNLQSFSELRGGMRSQLSQEKSPLSSSHFPMIHLKDNYCIFNSFMT